MLDDTPIQEVIDEIGGLVEEGYDLVFMTSRPEKYRRETERWLMDHGVLFYDALIMRPNGDMRKDTEVKESLYNKYFKDKYEVVRVYDDRPRVLRMWKSLGLKEVIDVGDGIEF